MPIIVADDSFLPKGFFEEQRKRMFLTERGWEAQLEGANKGLYEVIVAVNQGALTSGGLSGGTINDAPDFVNTNITYSFPKGVPGQYFIAEVSDIENIAPEWGISGALPEGFELFEFGDDDAVDALIGDGFRVYIGGTLAAGVTTATITLGVTDSHPTLGVTTSSITISITGI